MWKFPAIILGGAFSPCRWRGSGLAYVVFSRNKESAGRHSYSPTGAGSLAVSLHPRLGEGRCGHEAATALLSGADGPRGPEPSAASAGMEGDADA